MMFFGETTIFDVMIWSHPTETTNNKNGCLGYQAYKKWKGNSLISGAKNLGCGLFAKALCVVMSI